MVEFEFVENSWFMGRFTRVIRWFGDRFNHPVGGLQQARLAIKLRVFYTVLFGMLTRISCFLAIDDQSNPAAGVKCNPGAIWGFGHRFSIRSRDLGSGPLPSGVGVEILEGWLELIGCQIGCI